MAKEKRKKIKDYVEVKSFLPCNLSGQFSALNEGTLVSFLTNEFRMTSKLKIKKKARFKVIINDVETTFKFKDFTEVDKKQGTLAGLFYGIHDIFNEVVEDFSGFNVEIKTNIIDGKELNILVNICKSLNEIYSLEYSDFDLAKMIQTIYINYFGKVIPLLNVIAYFQKDVSYMVLQNNNLSIQTTNEHLDRYRFLMFVDGKPHTLSQYNVIFNSEYQIFDKLEKFFDKKLSEINSNDLFNYVYSPRSPFTDGEKFVITHFYEECKRSPQIFEGFKDKENNRKLFDGMNMSFIEQGSFLGFNKFNKFLEASAFKAVYKKDCAISLLNEENFNKFVFVVEKENLLDLFAYLKHYKYFKIHSLTINTQGIEMYRIL